jgi:hypothetical protein
LDGTQLIWIIRADSDRYSTFRDKNYRGQDWLKLLELFKSGDLLSEKWKPIEMEVYKKEEIERDQPIPDFTRGTVTKAISSKARSILEPLIAAQVEFLPLVTPYDYYYEMNVKYVDCLDRQHPKYEFLSEERRSMWIDEYAFYWEKLKGVHIFLLPELSISTLFCSHTFKKQFEDNNLTGFLFDKVPMEGLIQ